MNVFRRAKGKGRKPKGEGRRAKGVHFIGSDLKWWKCQGVHFGGNEEKWGKWSDFPPLLVFTYLEVVEMTLPPFSSKLDFELNLLQHFLLKQRKVSQSIKIHFSSLPKFFFNS